VLRTTDGGENWSDVTGNLSGLDAYCISAANDQRSWIGTGDGRIFVTTDGGVRWQEQPYADPQSPFIDGVWFFDPYNGYALGDPPSGSSKYVVLQTSDGGFTWEHLASEPVGASGEAGWNNSFWWADVSHGWFGTNKNRVWRTSDGGITWSFASTGGTNSLGVSFRDSRTGVAVHDDGSVARTTDGGGTWSRTTIASSGPLWAVSYAPGSPSAWTINTSRPYRTRNDGATWTTEGLYPFAGSLRHITFADSGRGWLVTSAGEILCYSPDVVNDVAGGNDAGVPVSTALSQNFPNPFNPTTDIRFQISDFGWVRLGVYDVLGREVALLVNERKAPGRYDVQFDASRLSSGIYVYRLVAGHYVEARRMVVVK
jgi:hypothetical protein